MAKIPPLDPSQLYRACDPRQLPFETTAELADHLEILGQDRAMEAVGFGVGMKRAGYNIFALGPSGLGKHTFVHRFLEQVAASESQPCDWCYVNNFEQPHKPKALKLPAGRGKKLRQDMARLLEELKAAIPAVFESDEYRTQVERINAEINERQEKAIRELGEEAARHDIALLHTPGGFSFAPMRKGEVISPEEYQKLSREEQERIVQEVEELEQKLEKVIRQFPKWRREQRERLKQLNRDFTLSAVGHLIDELKEQYADQPKVLEYLEAVGRDVTENVEAFRRPGERAAPMTLSASTEDEGFFRRYQVNVLVDSSDRAGAPVVFEDHPTYQNLVGRVEHTAQFGALVTDFTFIKPGALHRANGGYLLLDAYKLLSQPFAWEGLKRVLTSGEIRIESLGQMASLISTVSLEPEPIPLSIKVVLLGERMIYYVLHHYDPEFGELFKVAADFEERVERNGENDLLYARLIAGIARREGLLPLRREAVARVIEHGARRTGDAERLSTHMQSLTDLLREADYFAREDGGLVVMQDHVERAIEAQIRRVDRVKQRVFEAILRDTVLVSTDGEAVGQVNGLSVYDLGNYAFAQPTRITATTRLGEEGVVDIEREVNLGGAIHSKGVMILSSFFASRYSRNRPLSLAASLVFEQTYGTVEGDSASLAELCALLSSLSGVPIRQSLAVTGSVNQHGEVQAIGAVNEKIEGFFDICSARGLAGEHGVVIPTANVKHLMLRRDVVAAVEAGRFRVFSVATVDQAVEVLTGVPAGEPDATGGFPSGTINGLVVKRLAELAESRRKYAAAARGKGKGKP